MSEANEVKRVVMCFKNARAAIRQINNGEWNFKYCADHDCVYKATRGDLELWVSNGSLFCEIEEKPAFGLFFRHFVWFFAARRAKKKALKAGRLLNMTIIDT